METEEQKRVIELPVESGSVTRVVAPAGSGKTFVLIRLTEENPSKKFLTVSFNRSVREEAKTRFPRNTECHTFNSLAYASLGVEYARRGGLASSVSLKSICILFRAPLTLAASIRQTLENYLNSGEDNIGPEHLFVHSRLRRSADMELDIMDCSRKLWDVMKSGSNKFIKMTHSGCLKLFQLSRPSLDCDGLICDEGQDTNPVCMEIIKHQVHLGKAVVIVGDPRQQIYSWRGAVNAMDLIESKKIDLTNSFRFGERIAFVANKLMDTYGLQDVRTVGASGKTDGIYRGLIPQDRLGGTRAMIARTNVGAFAAALMLMDEGDKVMFNGDVGLFCTIVRDIFYLKSFRLDLMSEGGRLKGLENYDQLLEVCEVDPELNSMRLIVEKYKDEVPAVVERFFDGAIRDKNFADVIVTTTHKAKGLEYECVDLWDDFAPMVREGRLLPLRTSPNQERSDVVNAEDLNILYVAMTRAKRALGLPKVMEELLDLLRSNPKPEFYTPPKKDERGS